MVWYNRARLGFLNEDCCSYPLQLWEGSNVVTLSGDDDSDIPLLNVDPMKEIVSLYQ